MWLFSTAEYGHAGQVIQSWVNPALLCSALGFLSPTPPRRSPFPGDSCCKWETWAQVDSHMLSFHRPGEACERGVDEWRRGGCQGMERGRLVVTGVKVATGRVLGVSIHLQWNEEQWWKLFKIVTKEALVCLILMKPINWMHVGYPVSIVERSLLWGRTRFNWNQALSC